MENQAKFLEMLQEIKEIAQSQNNTITKEEIQKLLGEKLPEEQLKAVYQYLGENQIKVEGYAFIPDLSKNTEESKKEKDKETSTEKNSRKERNMQLYREELMHLDSDINEQVVFKYLNGDMAYKNTIIESHLGHVMELAQKYEKRNVSMDDVIAEGNMGLMQAMAKIEEEPAVYLKGEAVDVENFFAAIDREIVQAMESYIDEMVQSKDWEDTVLAKTNLLHEATKYMTEEIGRVPTIEELSEYTKISRKEIKDIMGLSEDAKRVADPKLD